MTQRFLIYFSYVGTNYKGMQRLVGRHENAVDFSTVQGILEFGIQKVLRIKEACLGTASRTDNGVHAIESAVHFDYKEGEALSPEKFCHNLNLFLEKNSTDIRIRRIVEVPTDFHARYAAFSRTYCLRIAVPRQNFYDSCINHSYITPSLPITELNRFQIVPPPFHPEPILDACKVFLGTWNFKAFSKPVTGRCRETLEEKDYIKTVRRISLTRVNSFIGHSYYLDPRLKEIDFFDFHVEGSGFLRRQVRRMVGALLGIGSGVVTENEIRFMLENPKPQNWNTKCNTALADGLYLKSVNFANDVPVIRGSLL